MQDLKIVNKKLNFEKNIPKIKIGKNAILKTLIRLTCASFQAQVRRVYSFSNTTMEILDWKIIFFNSNLQHNISRLKQPIASVPAFKGLFINTGLGIIISTKNQDE